MVRWRWLCPEDATPWTYAAWASSGTQRKERWMYLWLRSHGWGQFHWTQTFAVLFSCSTLRAIEQWYL